MFMADRVAYKGYELETEYAYIGFRLRKSAYINFLAKEFGATVFATDLWADPSNNWKRICEAGAQNLVFPIHADAHALPYADCFFDAVVCVNSYQFYGTSDTFLADHIARLLKPGGQFGLALWGPEMEF